MRTYSDHVEGGAPACGTGTGNDGGYDNDFYMERFGVWFVSDGQFLRRDVAGKYYRISFSISNLLVANGRFRHSSHPADGHILAVRSEILGPRAYRWSSEIEAEVDHRYGMEDFRSHMCAILNYTMCVNRSEC